MELYSLFTSESLILLETALISGIILFFLVSRDFTKGIYMWLLSAMFFKYQRLGVTDSILPYMSISRILFVFLTGLFLIEILSNKRRVSFPKEILYPMFLFCVLAIISMVWTGFIFKDGGGLNVGDLLTGYIFPFFMFFVGVNVYDTQKKREGFIKLILFAGLYLCLTAIFEHLGMDKFVFPKYILDPAFGLHSERARGPFVHAAVNGTVLGFVLSASFYFLINNREKLWKMYSWILLILSAIAIFFTYTRASWLAGLSGVAVIMGFAMRERKKLIIAVLLLCIIGMFGASFIMDDGSVVFAFERLRDESPVHGRLNLYVASFKMFLRYPLFGVGFGRFSEYVPHYFTKVRGISFRELELSEHDTFAGILTETGLVGIGLILLIYFFIVSESIRLYKTLGRGRMAERSMVIIFWSFMAVYIINSMFIEMRYFEFVNCLFFVFAGIICGWRRYYDEKIPI